VDGDDGFDVIDVADPRAPVVVGHLDVIVSYTSGVTVSGSYAYVCGYPGGFQVIDIADPKDPQFVGIVATPGAACQVAVSGSYAYVADYGSGLQVIDVSDPHHPFIAHALQMRGFARDVSVSEGYAYVAAAALDQAPFSGLLVVDVTDPTNSHTIGSIATPDWAEGVAISGTTAYVAGHYAGLLAVDIADPAHPRIEGEVRTGCAWDVAVSGTVACVGNTVGYDAGNWALQLIDITGSQDAPIVGSVHLPDQAYGLAVSGTYAYIADRVSGLQVVDFSDAGNPQIVASADLFWSIRVAVSGPYAYVTAGYGPRYLAVVDISNPLNPHVVGSVVLLGWSFGVAVSGHYAYIADAGAGMTVVDIADPYAPVVVANVATPGYADGIAVSGNHAYVAESVGLQIIDIEDPLNPWIVGSTSTGIAGITVQGSYAYATTSQSLQLIDVTNPEAPAIVSTVFMPAPGGGVAVSKGHAYVGSSELTVVDVADPYHPRMVGSCGLGGSVVVAGDDVCVGSLNASFQIARIQCEPGAVAPTVDPGSHLRLAAFPNPTPRQTTLRLLLPSREHVQASVVDVAGRRVRTLLDGVLGSGVHDLRWDGRDDRGRACASGVYLARARTSWETRATRVVLLR
jgi:hypothetical protein